MKILTNWNTTCRATVAAMMLTASAAGVTSCFNNNSNSRTSLRDVFVKEKVEDLVYKDNDVMIDRYIGHITKDYHKFYEKYHNTFESRGLYGGSVYIQRKEDIERQGFPWLIADKKKKATGLDDYQISISDPNTNPLVKEYYRTTEGYFKYQRNISENRENNFKANYLRKLDEDLFMDGEPTWQQCSNYLDREIASLDFLSQRDYEKCQEDIEKFKKAQKRRDDVGVAELLAYKQFKLDSLIFYNMFKECGFFQKPEDRMLYREYCKDPVRGYNNDTKHPQIGE